MRPSTAPHHSPPRQRGGSAGGGEGDGGRVAAPTRCARADKTATAARVRGGTAREAAPPPRGGGRHTLPPLSWSRSAAGTRSSPADWPSAITRAPACPRIGQQCHLVGSGPTRSTAKDTRHALSPVQTPLFWLPCTITGACVFSSVVFSFSACPCVLRCALPTAPRHDRPARACGYSIACRVSSRLQRPSLRGGWGLAQAPSDPSSDRQSTAFVLTVPQLLIYCQYFVLAGSTCPNVFVLMRLASGHRAGTKTRSVAVDGCHTVHQRQTQHRPQLPSTPRVRPQAAPSLSAAAAEDNHARAGACQHAAHALLAR